MAIQPTEFIWHNGELKPWAEANVHIMTHGLHYGSSIFEGVRVYKTPDGPKIFRCTPHIQRLFASARIYRMNVAHTVEEIVEVCKLVVRENKLDSAYLRPFLFRGDDTLALHGTLDEPVEVAVAAVEWGTYLGADALENGVDVCVSSWNRVAPNTIPPLAKAGGNYLSGQLITMEAKRNGYHEGIAMTTDGIVGEGAGENLFVVKDGVIFTPPSTGSILAGITRDSLMKIARRFGYEVHERAMPRELLYLADEMFFCGTACEVSPIRSVDRLDVGDGKRGPITKRIQSAFFGLFSGETEDEWGWLESV